MLALRRSLWLEMLAESWARYPEEACGLLLARPGHPDEPDRFVPITNAAGSSRVFELDSIEFMRAERAADDDGQEVVGVVHSHTHTAAFPSATDVAEATKPLVPPTWHWVIVSLGWGFPEVRSFSVDSERPAADGAGIGEEPVRLLD